MVLIAEKIVYSSSISRRSTRKYFFDAVADFDDIVEDKYKSNSRMVEQISNNVQFTTSYLFRRKSDCLSPDAHLTLKSKNPNELLHLSSLKKVNVFKRASNSGFRQSFTFPSLKRSQEMIRFPHQKSEVYSSKDRNPNRGLYLVRAKKSSSLSSAVNGNDFNINYSDTVPTQITDSEDVQGKIIASFSVNVLTSIILFLICNFLSPITCLESLSLSQINIKSL